MKHEDFGEKIGGARKDMWRGSKGLTVDDLEELNDRELEKYVTKKEIFGTNFFERLYNTEKYEYDALALMKLMYDKLDARPKLIYDDATKNREVCERYVEVTVRLKETLLDMYTFEAVSQAIKDFVIDNDYVRKGITYGYNYSSQVLKGDPINRSFCSLCIRISLDSKAYRKEVLAYAKRKQFLTPADKKFPVGYVCNQSSDGTYYVVYHNQTSGSKTIANKIPTEEEALRIARTYSHDQRTVVEKYVPPQLSEVKREGPEYRFMGSRATGNKLMNRYGFRGGEFGNWLTDADRQISLDMAYDSLSDLARALNITYDSIGLDNTLAIAFGSRGVRNALAHYEPLRRVINLTKLKGAGSLAHEWWHALDDYLCTKLTKYSNGSGLSNRQGIYPAMDALIDSYKNTRFLKQSEDADKRYSGKEGEPYWATNHEMSARAFACYVATRLGYRSDYICGHAYLSPAIPTGEEAEKIFEKFDQLFIELTKDNLLKLDEHKAEKEHEQQVLSDKDSDKSLTSLTEVVINYDDISVESKQQVSFEDLFNLINTSSINDVEKSIMKEKIPEVEVSYGDEYKYGMRLRGFSLGCQPSEGFVRREDSEKYYDILVYNRKLSPEELIKFDLSFIDNRLMNLSVASKEESLYAKKQSQQIRMQTGGIGTHSVVIDNGELQHDWTKCYEYIHTPLVDDELEYILSNNDYCFGTIQNMRDFCMSHPEAQNENGYTFILQSEKYSYLACLHPDEDIAADIYCYNKSDLERHMKAAQKGIRFITPNYDMKFTLADGERIKETYKDGTCKEYTARYIDDYHVELNGSSNNLYHICQLAELLERNEAVVEPIIPVDSDITIEEDNIDI